MSTPFSVDRIHLGAIDFVSGTVDPSAAAGITAPIGSSYNRTNGQVWCKTGAADTAWSQIPIAGQALTGNVLASRFLAADDAAAAPGHGYQSSLQMGMVRNAADQIALVGGGVAFQFLTGSFTNFVNNGVIGFNNQFQMTQAITPSIAADQNNWNPTSLASAMVIAVTNTAGGNLNITGLAGGAQSRLIFLVNASGNALDTVTCKHLNAGSTAANQFQCQSLADVVIPTDACALLIYQTTISKYRAFLI